MNTKLLLRNPKKYLLLFSSLFLLSAIPYYFAGSGLDNPEPMGSYLNANFPANLPQGLPYEPVFPNISFDSPLTFNELPNANKIIVGQRDGRVFWFDKTPGVSTKNSMIDLSDKVGVVWDGGFLGLTLHPEFGTSGNNYMYVYYSTEDENSNDFPNMYTTQNCDSEEYWGNFLVLARYTVNPTTLSVQESSEQVMLKLRMYGTTHRGGGLLFGDDDFLYLTTGDQTAYKKSQDIINNLDGGVLRMDVDQDPTKSHAPVRNMPNDHGFSDELTGNGYWIPNDNPFLSPTGANFEEYYSMGHRNPHRMTKDRATGKLYVGEIGGVRHEEINIVKKGGNFGWPVYEGFYENTSCVQELYNNMSHAQPLLAFPRAEANAVIGGYVYRGNEVPELQGKYLCADYGTGEEIFTVDINTGAYEQYGNFTSTNIISFGEDKQGELYILKLGTSSLFKITSKNTGFGNTPKLLSQTGAFSNLTNLTPTDGLVPYDLVESFWSDGALKKRWMAIPNNGSHDSADEKIGYSDIDDWDFPIGSVLVKHFELPINENNPSITKRLETRFSIKASDGNFYFVTYKWNDEQTDAELLTSGLEEDIDITNANGSTSKQIWSYPSTVDCVSCHNPATGGVLGAKTRYLNKDFTYSETGRTANQLVTLSHLGILDEAISDANTTNLLTSKAMNDLTASLDEKARSYLDLNCAYCHMPGTGNRGDFDLRLNLDILQTGILTASPYAPLGIPNEKIVVAGSPETSILYHRLSSVDPAIQMPPISKNKIDVAAVQLIDDWISQLEPDSCADRIIMETFSNLPGTTVALLKGNASFPDSPSDVVDLNEFRIPVNVADDYGVRVKGLLKAPETGTYYFWIAGDDNVELNLSTDENEANKNRIAYHENWSLDQEWNKYVTQKSAGVNLVAGQNYYLEALMNEGGGGDNLSVGWRKPSQGNGTVPFQVIPCTAFDFFNGASVTNVTGVNVTPASATVVEGANRQLTAAVSPTDADDTSTTWSSSNTVIATVNTNGRVTAIAAGTATITVTTTDGSFTDTSLITVERAVVSVTGVNVTPASSTVVEGTNRQLTAAVSPTDADDTSVTWSSSNTAIATVNVNGRVTAIAAGTVTITVTTTDGIFTDTSLITVERAVVSVTGVTVTPGAPTILEGATRQLTAAVSPSDADDTSVTWSSSNTAIARVNTNGLVTAVAAGIASITATTSDGDFTDLALITVEAVPVPVTGVTITPTSATLLEGATRLLNGTVLPSNADDTSVIWSSSDNLVATINITGRVTGISTGTATITVTTTDGNFAASALITVEAVPVGVTGVILSTNSVAIVEGATQLLTATVSPTGATNSSVTWSSSNPSIATVASNGRVTAFTEGTTTITVTTIDGSFRDTAVITVEAASVPATGVTVSPATATVLEGAPRQLTAMVIPVDADDPSVSWASSDTTIATVDASGLVTAVAAGTAIITGTTTDGSFTDTSLITVETVPVEVTGVSLSRNLIALVEGDTQVLSATVSPSDATNSSVTWSSSNPSIATVASNGHVTAFTEGTATITVTTTDGGYSDTATIEVTSNNPNTCTASGTILMERYDGIAGSEISLLVGAANYPDNPSRSLELSTFEILRNQGNNYGARVSGYLCAPETGTYYFHIAGNNHTELNLSTTDNEADKVRIAHHEDYVLIREWDKFSTQKSQAINLIQGNTYYIEALMKEAAFGDNLAVAWTKPSVSANVIEIIPGSVLSPRVVDEVAVSGVALSPSSLTLSQGEEAILGASVSPLNATNRNVNWSSSNTAIAAVDSNGQVRGVAQGIATITVATADGNFTATSRITVTATNVNTCTASGSILMERYNDIPGVSIADLLNAPNYPNNPSLSAELFSFEIPENTGDSYGVRVSGYLCAPETGAYYFFVAGNNSVELNLSTSDNEADKVRIAHHEEWTGIREWSKFNTQKSLGIVLTKGDSYYIEGLMKEAAFGDNLAVGWRKPSDGNGASVTEVIPGSVLSPEINSNPERLVNISELTLKNETSITLVPNPATTQVQITLNNLEEEDSDIRYTIYSFSGVQVLSIAGERQETIDISRLASGTYQIVAEAGSWSASTKLIVK